MDSKAFYDEYVGRQLAAGVNKRHVAIAGWLERFGLKEGHRVLEIGCGVGTVTGLILEALGPQGSLLAVDLSPKSIEAAGDRLDSFPNLQLEAGDVLEMEVEGPFDVIVLPDVIEHIPLELHSRLFSRLRDWVAADGFILLHYPNPWYLQWCQENRPDLLQHVDQPIHADQLSANAYSHGLYLDFLETYSIWIREGDYVAAVLRPVRGEREFHQVEEGSSSIRSNLRRLLGKLLP